MSLVEGLMGGQQAVSAYAGVGSRATPVPVLDMIEAAARQLAEEGWTMRTGLSPGADQAFYRGAVAGGGPIELYLPWPGFEAGVRASLQLQSVFALGRPDERAYGLAARWHPNFAALEDDARRLLARDVHEVLGADLASPVAFVLCWTPDGDLDGTGRRSGGTGQALRVAATHGIRVLNLARPAHADRLARHLSGS